MEPEETEHRCWKAQLREFRDEVLDSLAAHFFSWWWAYVGVALILAGMFYVQHFLENTMPGELYKRIGEGKFPE